MKRFLILFFQAVWRKVRYPDIRQIALGCKPDPFNFTIETVEHINGNTIVLATFHGCESFGGHKLILLHGEWNEFKTLDPHFLNEEYPVIARFIPNQRGWRMARASAMRTDTSG